MGFRANPLQLLAEACPSRVEQGDSSESRAAPDVGGLITGTDVNAAGFAALAYENTHYRK